MSIKRLTPEEINTLPTKSGLVYYCDDNHETLWIEAVDNIRFRIATIESHPGHYLNADFADFSFQEYASKEEAEGALPAEEEKHQPKWKRPTFINPDDEEERRSEFQSLAESKDWKCNDCGNTISLEEKEIYFAHGRCSRCQHNWEKD